MKMLLRRMLDETEFLSDYGVRALSRHHAEHPYIVSRSMGMRSTVAYEPAESDSGLFGGNSQLARADLVPGELPDHRVAAEVPPLLRRRLQGRMPDRLGPVT